MRVEACPLLVIALASACAAGVTPVARSGPVAASARYTPPVARPLPDAECRALLQRASARPTADAATVIEALGPRCPSVLRRELPAVMTAWHRTALDPIDVSALEAAERLYRLWLDAFSTAAPSARLRYYRAELLWELAAYSPRASSGAAWDRAADAYAAVVSEASLPAAELREAAYSWVVALRNTGPEAPVDEPLERRVAREGGGAGPEPLSPRDARMHEALRSYLALAAPGDPETTSAHLLAARLMFRHRRYAQAVPDLESSLEADTDVDTAGLAMALLFDSLVSLGRDRELGAWVDRLRGEPRFAAIRSSPDRRDQLSRLARTLARRGIAALEARGDFAGCGRAYESLAHEDRGAADDDELLYDAAVCFAQASLHADARRVAGEIIRRHRGSSLVRRARELLAR